MSAGGPTSTSRPPAPEVLAAALLAACEGDRAAVARLLADTAAVVARRPSLRTH